MKASTATICGQMLANLPGTTHVHFEMVPRDLTGGWTFHHGSATAACVIAGMRREACLSPASDWTSVHRTLPLACMQLHRPSARPWTLLLAPRSAQALPCIALPWADMPCSNPEQKLSGWQAYPLAFHTHAQGVIDPHARP